MKTTVLIFLLGGICFGQEVYEDGKEVCSRCKCTTSQDNDTLVLDCSKQGYKNMLNVWPKQPKKLEASFSFNEYTRLQVLPSTNSELKVTFSHCGIEEIESGLFEAVVNVVYADFSYNYLTASSLTPDIFKGPYNNTVYEPIGLRHLNLSFNTIHSLQHDVFEHLPNLEVLDLQGNHFRVLDLVTQQALSSVPTLQVLNLANNQLTDLDDNAVRRLTKLKEINLQGNDLDFVPENLGLIGESLERLYVDDNPIVELEFDTFMGLPNIIEVSLNNLPKLRSVKANAFAPLKKLKKLHLCNNENLVEIEREAFADDQIIDEVYLMNNSLKTLDLTLLPWSKLKILDITGNNFICSCDLYNISRALSNDIRRNKEGARCQHPVNFESRQIYWLKSDICMEQATINLDYTQTRNAFNSLRVSLITLTVILILASMIAMWLGWNKWTKFRRSRDYPISHIVYNPLSSSHM